MYDKFGKWAKEVWPDNGKHPILGWEKIKLFDEDNQLFTVYTYGEEKWEEIYASVLVYDENGNDCLEENHPSKKKVIDYFAKGIQKLSNKNAFYNIYWESVNKYKPVTK